MERYIRIETDVFDYAIGEIFSQLILNDLDQWHPVIFFSQKMISAKTWYEIHNGKLLFIINVFKTWKHYLKGYKYEVFVLTDYNNL